MLAGSVWEMQVTASSWHGAGTYTGVSPDLTVTVFNVASPSVIWENSSATSSATFDTDHSATVNAVLSSHEASGTDHVTGSLSCAAL